MQQLSLGVEMRGKSMKIGDVVTLELQKCEVSQWKQGILYPKTAKIRSKSIDTVELLPKNGKNAKQVNEWIGISLKQ